MNVIAITATCGRHYCVERTVRMFLEQDYDGDHTLLIYNNSDIPQSIDVLPHEFHNRKNKAIYLINKSNLANAKDKRYTNLGDIYMDALSIAIEFGPFDVITFMDDDDIFLPNHISEGVKGLKRAHDQGKTAYKPIKSYFRHAGGVDLMSNTLEPSIFVDFQHIVKYGFSPTTTDQHLQWVNPLVYNNQILVDDLGKPTLIYNWGDDFPTFKTSGDAGNINNFNNYRRYSQDHGDRIIKPCKLEDIEKIYATIK